MHHCLNLVTEREGFPAAILIRALEPTVGVDRLRAARPHLRPEELLSGPGRVGAGLALGRGHDGLDLASGPLWIGRGRRRPPAIATAPRVGIRVARERRWRFAVTGHPSVSRPRPRPAAAEARG